MYVILNATCVEYWDTLVPIMVVVYPNGGHICLRKLHVRFGMRRSFIIHAYWYLVYRGVIDATRHRKVADVTVARNQIVCAFLHPGIL